MSNSKFSEAYGHQAESSELQHASVAGPSRKSSSEVDQLARILAIYFDVEQMPNEDSIDLLERSVDAACRFRAIRT